MKRAPNLIVLSGLPGTGKSTLAEAVAERLNASWLRVDTLEAAMVKAGVPRSFETGLAAYVGCRDQAADQLRIGRSVVIDAVNGVEPARRMWSDLAEELRAKRFTIHVTCPDLKEHRRRVEDREARNPPLPKPTWGEVTEREFQPWDEPVLVVDTTALVAQVVEQILDYVGRD